MRKSGGENSTLWEWLTVFGLTALAVIGSEGGGLSQKWEDAVVYTTMVFVCVLLALRPAWGRPGFWSNIVGAFVAHLVGVIIVVDAAGTAAHGIPKIFLIIGGMVEGVFLISVLWKRTVGRAHENHSRT